MKPTRSVKNITFQVFEEWEALKDEMIKALTGNQASAKRSRVKAVAFAKKLKEYRVVTVEWKKTGSF